MFSKTKIILVAFLFVLIAAVVAARYWSSPIKSSEPVNVEGGLAGNLL